MWCACTSSHRLHQDETLPVCTGKRESLASSYGGLVAVGCAGVPQICQQFCSTAALTVWPDLDVGPADRQACLTRSVSAHGPAPCQQTGGLQKKSVHALTQSGRSTESAPRKEASPPAFQAHASERFSLVEFPKKPIGATPTTMHVACGSQLYIPWCTSRHEWLLLLLICVQDRGVLARPCVLLAGDPRGRGSDLLRPGAQLPVDGLLEIEYSGGLRATQCLGWQAVHAGDGCCMRMEELLGARAQWEGASMCSCMQGLASKMSAARCSGACGEQPAQRQPIENGAAAPAAGGRPV